MDGRGCRTGGVGHEGGDVRLAGWVIMVCARGVQDGRKGPVPGGMHALNQARARASPSSPS
jgi:hypothetical protein